MWNSVWLRIMGPLARILPRVMLKKLFKIERLQRELEVNLSSAESVRFSLKAILPILEISLRLSNKSEIPLVVDRIIFDVSIGQPFAEFTHCRRISLAPRQTLERIYSRHLLNEAQVKLLRQSVDAVTGRFNGTVTIRPTLYCDSKIGSFCLIPAMALEIRGDCIPVN
jgi:hypothetical protein